jgi:hypothetical protein
LIRRWLLVALSTVYLGSVWVSGVSLRGPDRWLPRAVRPFTQVACLLPYAPPEYRIEYRAEGWSCASGRFLPLDPSAAFPAEADDGRSRFSRVMERFFGEPRVMEKLDEFLVLHASTSSASRIGGLRLVSERVPITADETSAPTQPVRVWYETPGPLAEFRCRGTPK